MSTMMNLPVPPSPQQLVQEEDHSYKECPSTSSSSSMSPSSSSRSNKDHENDTTGEAGTSQSPSQPHPNFHQVLQKLGKTVFRPGGTDATHTLHQWSQLLQQQQQSISHQKEKNNNSNNKNKIRILEYSAGCGTSAMALCDACQCYGTILTSQQPGISIPRITTAIQQRHMEHFINPSSDIQFYDPHSSSSSSSSLSLSLSLHHQYSAAILEATLTHCDHDTKRKILRDFHDHTDQLLLHNVCFFVRDNDKDNDNDNDSKTRHQQAFIAAQDEVSRALIGDGEEGTPQYVGSDSNVGNCGFYPLAVQGWTDLVTECGYHVTHVQAGPLVSLSPRAMIQDEGFVPFMTLVFRLLTHPEWRTIVVRVKQAMTKHDSSLGYIILRATTMTTTNNQLTLQECQSQVPPPPPPQQQ